MVISIQQTTDDDQGDETPSFQRYPISIFFVLTFALTWGWWTFAYVVLARGELSDVLALPGAFGPVIAAAFVTWLGGDDLRAWATQVIDWRVAPQWYLATIGIPLGITLGGVGTGLFLAGASIDLSVLGQRLPIFPVVLVLMLLVGGGQEELG